MAKCRIDIEIDGENRRFRVGEAITGRVIVEVDKEVTPKNLVIEQTWKTHGRGNTDSGSISQQVEPGRPWMPGMSYTHAFRFDVPASPISYHGHLINIDHYITARADVKWSIDPRAEADYLVQSGPGSRDAYLDEARGNTSETAQQHSGCMKALGWVLAPLLLVMMLMLLTMLLPIILVVGTVKLARRGAAERKVGKVNFEIEAETVEPDEALKPKPMAGLGARIGARFGRMVGKTYIASPGDTVSVSLRFTPRGQISVDAVQLVLTARESATAGSGTNSHTHHHDVLEQVIELSGPRMYSPGSEVRFDTLVTIPEDAPFSFDSSDNDVDWSLTARIDIPQWPDWVRANDLLVVPAR